MGSVVEIGGIIGWLAIAGPLFALIAGLIVALSWPHRSGDASSDNEIPQPVGASAAAQARASESGIGNSQAAQPGERDTGPSRGGLTTPSSVPRGAARTSTEDFDIDASARENLQTTIGGAAASSTESTAARALLEEAARERKAGNDAAASECLRGAIMLASKVDDRKLHAAARLELGDICQSEGDLQTACEHWQLARSLFQEEQRGAEASKCEDRMSRNQCPTDWVLTDF